MAKEIFDELDNLCEHTGIGLGVSLEDAIANNARDEAKMREELKKLKESYLHSSKKGI